MVAQRAAGPAMVVVGLVGWLLAALLVVADVTTAVVLWALVLVGPAWAYSLCLASDEADFAAGAGRDRRAWLRLLPWTFVLAPVVLPTLVLLVQFFRDARADGGQTWLGSGRSRPGEGGEDIWR